MKERERWKYKEDEEDECGGYNGNSFLFLLLFSGETCINGRI